MHYQLPSKIGDGLGTPGSFELCLQQRELLFVPSNRQGGGLGGIMSNQRQLKLPAIVPVLLAAIVWASCIGPCNAEPDVASGIRVRHVYGDAVYLAAGSIAGLSKGQKLTVLRREKTGDQYQAVEIGEIEIESVVPTSSAGRILNSSSEIIPGDTAYLTQSNLRELQQQRVAQDNQQFAQLVSFTEGSPPVQEKRESLPKPPLPEINRFRGRFGFDTNILQNLDSGNTVSQLGFMLRLDATRLGGTYWSVNGYHRGKFQSRTNYQNETLNDLINRTYQLSLTYNNPRSNWVAGGGRLLIPWASSLNTMDGFYFGRRFGRETVGLFGGTNPDPSDWNYDPNRQMGGAFVNLDHGNFDSFRFISTSGIAVSRIDWDPDRQFGFFENRLFYKQFMSIYSNIEADLLTASQNNGNSDVVLSRSYLTVRVQPHKVVSFDLNENYYRNLPTFDPRLIGTGLLDKFLFQGLSGGVRLSLPHRLGIFGNTGRSSRTGDQRPTWNYLGGASLGNILDSGIRGEYRYSRFDTSFGRGIYQTAMLSREVAEGLRFELQLGRQSIQSAYTTQDHAWFVNGNVDWYLGANYLIGGGVTAYRGDVQRYNQYFINLGYRFDNYRRRYE